MFQVAKIQTPFLIMQGTADGAVDWNQGLEYYTSARKAGKNVIFLSYPNEPHHLAIKANQIDFLTRMKQYFDHYLMGAPAPSWMVDGVPQTKKGTPNQLNSFCQLAIGLIGQLLQSRMLKRTTALALAAGVALVAGRAGAVGRPRSVGASSWNHRADSGQVVDGIG